MPIARALLAAVQISVFAVAMPPAAVRADTLGTREPGGSYRTVRDLDNRFTIAVPAAWKVTTSRGDPALSAVAPPTDGGLPASLVVIVRDLPLAITPETCVYEAQYVMRRAIQRYTSVAVGPDHIGALPAWSHAYIWTARTGEERRSVQVCVTVGRRAILAIGTTSNRPARLRDDMPALTRAIQSLQPAANPSEPEPTHGGHNMSRGVVRRGSM
ncbi:MAG: DcrB/PsbP domain-containing protein [bacterium]